MKSFWNPKWTASALFAVGLVVGVGAAAAVALVLRPHPTPAPTPSPVVDNGDNQQPAPTSTDQIPAPTNPDALPPDNTDELLNVEWHKANKITYEAALGSVVRATIADPTQQNQTLQSVSSSVVTYGNSDTTGFWDLGTIHGGAYDGSHYLYWLTNQCDPGGCDDFRFIVTGDGKRALLLQSTASRDSTSVVLDGSSGVNVVNMSSVIAAAPNLQVPSLPKPAGSLTLDNGRLIKLNNQYSWNRNGISFTDSLNGTMKGLKKIGHAREGSDLYTVDDAGGCVFIFGNDGMPYSYSSLIPAKEEKDNYFGDQPIIQWDDGFKTDEQFTAYRVGGCGLGTCSEVISASDVGDMDALQHAGTTTEGDPIYVPKHPVDNPIVKAVYDTWMPLGQNGQYTTVKPDFSTFMKSNPIPVFFWKDGFGRWVRYLSSNATPPGECGKPVIYLYPEKTESVSVRLPSFINVTVSDPAYPANGWNVTAQPDGTLTDKRDGKTYSSLYWEGTGVGYVTPTDGWVIKDSDIETFLSSTLPKYGLNAQETKDFMDFWVPKMHAMHAPYDRVSFLTSEWSKAAPLFVSPRPTTAIRIFMDWKPLSAPIDIAAPKVTTPPRDGFTLVEWGGTLWK